MTAMLLPAPWAAACDGPLPLDVKQPGLQAGLERALHGAGLGEDVRGRRLAVAVVDLTEPEGVAYAGLNDDVMLYAASLPKIAILLAVVQLALEGRIAWTPDFDHKLRKMITVSDNNYASWGVDTASLDGIAEVLQRPEYCLYERPHGGLWVGRAYRKQAPTRRDPSFSILHGATARQTARFYALLDRDRLVSPYGSARMRDLMGPPEWFHKLVAGLGDRHGVTFVARKSGTWQTFHSDGALVQHHRRRYAMVGLTDDPDGEAKLRRLAGVVDDLILLGDHRDP